MNRFCFSGIIPASKSNFNRALICASYGQGISLRGESSCDDVKKMKEALSQLGENTAYDCGSAGTVLRFLALRLSRIPGQHILKGTERLMSRPHDDLHDIFSQLNIKMELHSDRLLILSPEGWKPKNNILNVNREISSQFASGILLNSWDLDFPLRIQWHSGGVSEGYWQMTAQVVKDFGMELTQDSFGVTVLPHAKTKIQFYNVESDVSSAFAIAAYAALNGEATFQKFPFGTLQPDVVFLQILEKMGVGIERRGEDAHVFQKTPGHPNLKGINWNLHACPDVFPVLATLCGFAKGYSRLDGAPQLIFKESNRIQKTAELLNKTGIKTKILSDGIEIHPHEGLGKPNSAFGYETDHDHRLAFAAALVASQKYPIHILHREVVNKSFPEFWDILVNNTF